MPEFDERKIMRQNPVHLNGGAEFNYTTYTLTYDGREVGAATNGRRNQTEKFSEAMVVGCDTVFKFPEEKDAFLKQMERLVCG